MPGAKVAACSRAPRGGLDRVIMARVRSVPLGMRVALGVFTALGALTCVDATNLGHPAAWLAMAAIPAAALVHRRPLLFGLALTVGAIWLRLVFAGLPVGADQLIVGQAALQQVLAGGSPYGIGYAASMPPGAPFVYGPLMLLTAPLGVIGEVLAGAGVMVLLTLRGSFVTLAVYGALGFAVQLSTSGINDGIPAFVVFAGLLALERHRRAGGVLLAVAAALKPYAFAWFPAAIGFGGMATAVAALGVTAICWAPLVVWGPSSFLRSLDLAAAAHPVPANSFDLPAGRLLAIPIGALSLLVRRWTLVVLSGTAIFVVVLFFDRWASVGYLLVILPLFGYLLERRSPSTGSSRQAPEWGVRGGRAAGTGR